MRRRGLGVLIVLAASCCALIAVAQPAAKPKDKPAAPPRETVTWSNTQPGFKGVIDTPHPKYTMFHPDGEPVRAADAAKVKEAAKTSMKSKTGTSKSKTKDDE